MRTETQVEVYFFKISVSGKMLFLLAKRTSARGGFWQPMTGGVEQGETLEQAIYREGEEEFGIKKIIKLIETGYSFDFTDENGYHLEYVYGAEVEPEVKIILSREHDEFCWIEKDEAFRRLIWPGNKEGLKKLSEILDVSH